MASTSSPGRNSRVFPTCRCCSLILRIPSRTVVRTAQLLAIAGGARISAIPRSPAHRLLASVSSGWLEYGDGMFSPAATGSCERSESAQQGCREPWHRHATSDGSPLPRSEIVGSVYHSSRAQAPYVGDGSQNRVLRGQRRCQEQITQTDFACEEFP